MPDTPTTQSSYDDLFAQPFAPYIIKQSNTVFDLSLLSETEYESLMTWLYAAGWDLLVETRATITVDPEAKLPPRLWVPLATATTATRSRRRPATIPRFCRHGPNCPDQDAGCYSTHTDTIH